MENEPSSVESPYSLNYVKMWKTFSGTVAAWPREKCVDKENTFIKVYRVQLPVMGILATIAIVAYIHQHYSELDFITRGHLFLTVSSSITTTLRCCVPITKRYRKVAVKFFSEFHLIHFKHKGEFYLKVNNLVDVFSYYFTLCLVIITIIASIIYQMPALYHDYKIGAFTNNRIENSTLEYSFYYIIPGLDPEEMLFPYTTLNFYLVYLVSAFHCTLDLYLSLIVFHIIGHIYILRHNLISIPRPKNKTMLQVNDVPVFVEMFDDEENEEIGKVIVECIKHHRLIISFTDEVSVLFGPTTAISYLFHLFSCCIALLQCFSGDPRALTNYGVFTLAVFGQLCHISILFEVLSSTSEKLIDAVYSIPWECMNVPNRRTVLMLLRRAQKPIRITALGLAEVGLQTMVGILKATFSYYTFFSSFDE